MFGYAKEHEPCIIFMDEIDAIGGRRFSEGTSADREIQRTLMELLNQLDGFDYLGKTKIIMATNRPDTLDPALLRAGRLDRKIEIPLPNEAGRLEVLKIHAEAVQKEGDIDYESVVKMSDGLNGADLRNVVTEAGLFAIKDYRDAVNQDDFNKAVRKVAESKKLEGKLERVLSISTVVRNMLTLVQISEALSESEGEGAYLGRGRRAGAVAYSRLCMLNATHVAYTCIVHYGNQATMVWFDCDDCHHEQAGLTRACHFCSGGGWVLPAEALSCLPLLCQPPYVLSSHGRRGSLVHSQLISQPHFQPSSPPFSLRFDMTTDLVTQW